MHGQVQHGLAQRTVGRGGVHELDIHHHLGDVLLVFGQPVQQPRQFRTVGHHQHGTVFQVAIGVRHQLFVAAVVYEHDGALHGRSIRLQQAHVGVHFAILQEEAR